MSSRSKSAINGRTIDIGHLEREIRQDVAAYRQYKAEDGMKKRAIHSSKDYDEFRNFVSVSHLKPTSGRDISSLFSGASGTVARGSVRSGKVQGGQGSVGGFDDIIQRRKDATNPSTPMSELDGNVNSLSLGKAPKIESKDKANKPITKTSREFFREWKQHCQTAKDTLSFLATTKDGCEAEPFEQRLLLQPDVICKEQFSTDIDSDILGDIVEALHLLMCMKESDNVPVIANETRANNNVGDDGYQEAPGLSELLSSESNVLSYTHSWLEALTTCGRFELGVSFLMPNEQLKLKEICNFVKHSYDDNSTHDEKLLSRYYSLLS